MSIVTPVLMLCQINSLDFTEATAIKSQTYLHSICIKNLLGAHITQQLRRFPMPISEGTVWGEGVQRDYSINILLGGKIPLPGIWIFFHYKFLTPVIMRIVRKAGLVLGFSQRSCPRTEIIKPVIFVVDLTHILRTPSMDVIQFLTQYRQSIHALWNWKKTQGIKSWISLGDIIMPRNDSLS